MSGRAGRLVRGAAFVAVAGFVAVACVVAVGPFFAAGDMADFGAAPAQATCAHDSPDRAISSPGWMRVEQTPQAVAYFAVIGTPPP
jgi:hypothetical protein